MCTSLGETSPPPAPQPTLHLPLHLFRFTPLLSPSWKQLIYNNQLLLCSLLQCGRIAPQMKVNLGKLLNLRASKKNPRAQVKGGKRGGRVGEGEGMVFSHSKLIILISFFFVCVWLLLLGAESVSNEFSCCCNHRQTRSSFIGGESNCNPINLNSSSNSAIAANCKFSLVFCNRRFRALFRR